MNNKVFDVKKNPEISLEETKRWFNKKYQLHRWKDLPAIEYKNGNKVWYKNGLIHRDNDLPAVDLINGTKKWYKNGIPFRKDKPAVTRTNGDNEYYINNNKLTELEFISFNLAKNLKENLPNENHDVKKNKI